MALFFVYRMQKEFNSKLFSSRIIAIYQCEEIPMSGLVATVLLRKTFLSEDAGRVTDILRTFADDVTETRKGRHWDFVFNNTVASLSVFSTSQRAYDYEDLLLANDLLFEDTPEVIEIYIGTKRECNREMCSKLSEQLSQCFDGINCGLDN